MENKQEMNINRKILWLKIAFWIGAIADSICF